MTHEVERLLAQIEELNSSISRDVNALSHTESKHASSDLWANIRMKMAKRRKLCHRLPGPPPSD